MGNKQGQPASDRCSQLMAPDGSGCCHVLLQVQGMVKHFETKRGLFKAVDGVSVEMQPGTITALLG